MTGPSPVQRLHANIAYLKKRGASRERIQQEIDRFQQTQDEISAKERRLSGAEKGAAVASKYLSGLTFGLFDEMAGLGASAVGAGTDTMNEQRFLQKQLAEENPKTAFLAEVAGAASMPGSIFGAAPKAASALARGGRVLAEGAAQGALAGVGNAEGSLEDRLKAARSGATVGSAVSGLVGGVGRVARPLVSKAGDYLAASSPRLAKVLPTPSLDDLVMKTGDEDVKIARQRLVELEARGLAHEATVADVLPQGEGELRQAATSNRAVRTQVDNALRARSNRLANEADARLDRYTGSAGESPERALRDLDQRASTEAKPFYQQAEQEAASFEQAAPRRDQRAVQEMRDMGVPEEKIDELLGAEHPVRKQLREAADLPYVRKRIRELKADPRGAFKDSSDDSHALLDQVYKDIGDDIRGLSDKEVKSGLSSAERQERRDFIQQRDVLRSALKARAGSYGEALAKYAGPKASAKAFERGTKAGQHAPDVLPDELASLDAAEVPFYKSGAAENFRAGVPTPELKDLARFHDVLRSISDRDQARRFKALYGEEKFKSYLGDLMEIARMQRMKAGAGESTTIDKLMEQLQSDPEAAAQAFGALIRGNPVRSFIHVLGNENRFLNLFRKSRTAQAKADFLLRGGGDIPRSLDEIVGVRQAAQKSTGRTYRGQGGRRVLGLLSRQAGAEAGRP